MVFVLLSVDVRKLTFAHKKLQELTSDDEKRAHCDPYKTLFTYLSA